MYKPLFQRLVAVAIFIISSIQIVNAQTSVTGYVMETGTGDPLIGANVVQTGSTNGTSTNTEGFFELNLKDSGQKSLTVTYLGYTTKTIDLENESGVLSVYLEPSTEYLEGVIVQSTRVDESTPFTFTNISNEELEENNLGQDVPYLLKTTPSVVTTSDAGAGIGYTGIRIRGVDPSRINVTINGIPVNDAESHGMFWVDLPDIASSLENIQIQRGVGTSTNGAGAFGASINLQTSMNKNAPFAEVNTGLGSFNTWKTNVIAGTGLIGDGWKFEGRVSKILSDGFIDRASADLNSFYVSGSKRGERSLLKADVFSGHEVTYQAWNGVEESVLESGNRTYNEAGTERPGEPYDNQVDDYRQDYYQLHYLYEIASNWTVNTSLHYTKGKGFYEEYKADETLGDYGLVIPGSSESDLVRRRWLDNDFYGGVFSTNYDFDGIADLTIGGGIHQYDGGHFGEVIWTEQTGDFANVSRYYDNDANKLDANIYAKLNYNITGKLNTYLDLQGRKINYTFLGLTNNNSGELVPVELTDKLFFFNPKFGIVFQPDFGQRLFLSFGVASKEPTRDEYVNSTENSRPKFETLYNLEAGYSYTNPKFFGGASVYGMFYDNQLVLTGQINDVGAYIRDNVDNSYRIGLELEGGVQLTNQVEWALNATFSQNKIEKVSEFIDDYDNGGQIEREFTDTDIAFSPNIVGNSVLSFSDFGFTGEFITKYVSRQYLDNTQDVNRSLDPYLVNDLKLSYKLDKIDVLKAVTATLQVSNVLDTKYETNGYTYGYIWDGEQRFNYYYPQAGRNYLLQIKWEF